MSQGPADLQSAALATELCTHGCPRCDTNTRREHDRAGNDRPRCCRRSRCLSLTQLNKASQAPTSSRAPGKSCEDRHGVHNPSIIDYEDSESTPGDIARTRIPIANLQHFRGPLEAWKMQMDTLGIEPRASRMLSGCDTTTPCAHCFDPNLESSLWLLRRRGGTQNVTYHMVIIYP